MQSWPQLSTFTSPLRALYWHTVGLINTLWYSRFQSYFGFPFTPWVSERFLAIMASISLLQGVHEDPVLDMDLSGAHYCFGFFLLTWTPGKVCAISSQDWGSRAQHQMHHRAHWDQASPDKPWLCLDFPLLSCSSSGRFSNPVMENYFKELLKNIYYFKGVFYYCSR